MSKMAGIDFCDLNFFACPVGYSESQNQQPFQKTSETNWTFPAITLRGALGRSLKHLVCHARGLSSSQCDACLLRERCPYALIFDGLPFSDRKMLRSYPFAPQPFMFRDVQWNPSKPELKFNLRLLGPIIDFYPYMIVAVEKMLEGGLGKNRQKFTLLSVSDSEKLIHEQGQNGIASPSLRHLDYQSFLDSESQKAIPIRVQMNAVTPIHIRTEGRFNPHPNFSELVRAGLRRLKLLNYFYGDQQEVWPTFLVDLAEQVRTIDQTYSVWSLNRYSGRQKRKIPLEGVYLSGRYDRCDPRLGVFLHMMSELHLGKYSSFGLGQIQITVEANTK